MKRLKKITSIVLALVVILSGLIVSTSNVSALANIGNCGADGNNATWQFDSGTKTLTISGEGAMQDYEDTSSPFYNSDIQNLVIENGITSIGKRAFIYNQLTSVTIPNSVTTIGDYAFAYNKLASATISTCVTTIGNAAFANNKLTSVTIPTSVTTIGVSAFYGNKLTSIIIPTIVTSIGYGAFASNDTLTKAVILNKNAVIGNTDYNVFLGASANFKLYGYANSTASAYANNTEYPAEFVELKEITDTMISDIATQYYKGNAITPTLKINDGARDLVLDTDYTVSYKDNDKVGTATVIVTGIDAYEFNESITKAFEIKKQQYKITVINDEHSTVTPSSEAMVDYDGSKEYVIKANDGYAISLVLVNGEEKISTLNNDTLTISNPTKDTTIEVISKVGGKDQTTPTDPTTPTNPVDTNTNVNTKDTTQVTLWLSLLGFSAFVGLGYVILNKKRKIG